MPAVQAPPLAARSPARVPQVPDAILLARLRSGDGQAFEAIFRRYQPPLLSYCRHMLGGRDDAEDALQQTFIRAHRALLSDTPARELRPWLYAVARNCCRSAAASRRPTANLEDHEPSFDGLSEQAVEREDLRELVLDLQALPDDQRSALLLAELEDLPHNEIAAILECPVRKVKALIHQARTTLIAQRKARAAPCEEIRMQISLARGGELRRGSLRRHLSLCAGCSSYAADVRGQRVSLALILPVAPSSGLAARVLGHAALHSGSIGGAGGLAAAGSGHAITAAIASGGASGTAVASVPISNGASALLGGGLAAKLAAGGAVAVLATAGAATTLRHLIRHRPPSTAALRAGPTAGSRAGRGYSTPAAAIRPGGAAPSTPSAPGTASPGGGPSGNRPGPRAAAAAAAAGPKAGQRRLARRRLRASRRPAADLLANPAVPGQVHRRSRTRRSTPAPRAARRPARGRVRPRRGGHRGSAALHPARLTAASGSARGSGARRRAPSSRPVKSPPGRRPRARAAPRRR